MKGLEITGSGLWLDEKPFRLLSGSVHYFRVVPAYWRDRLEKLKACGLNTVETYVPWNLHEPEKGRFVFEGLADLEGFLDCAQALGLHVLLRPGPYICAEWEFGGLPAWLLCEEMNLRCRDPRFLKHAADWFSVLLPRVTPHLTTNGGNIIAVQIENEYGSYGNDKTYLAAIRDLLLDGGVDVPLFTCDGPDCSMLAGGQLEDVWETVNFGSGAKEAFESLERVQPGLPRMCTEFWVGWFDHWGERHHTRDTASFARDFEEALEQNGNINVYMFHGGTNFGLMNGANHDSGYAPTVTSYDYDALVDESGVPTEKFTAAREILTRCTGIVPPPLPAPLPRAAYGRAALTRCLALADCRPEGIASTAPLSMEQYGQNYGYILYETIVHGPYERGTLCMDRVRDRAHVYINGAFFGILERGGQNTLEVEFPAGESRLSILVENMGRVNYGPYLADLKGLLSPVRFRNQFLFDWTAYPLSMEQIPKAEFSDGPAALPAYFRGTLCVDAPADTFLYPEGLEKGLVYVNGFLLGRYWSRGPQRALYLPAPLLKKGGNDIVVFETDGAVCPAIRCSDRPDLG